MNSPITEPHQPNCDAERLQNFLDSDQYDLGDDELIAHLDTCEACRIALESRAGNEHQWNLATEILQPTEFDEASRSEFSAATSTGSESSFHPSVSSVLDSLVPSEDPHHLGRLGPYEVTGVIGVGGMGVVLKAIDPSLDRIVAVKVMSPSLAGNDNSRKRFAREAKAAAAVLHPNVVPIHSVSSDSKLPYLVMACIRGGSLQNRLEAEGPLPPVEVLRIGSQIAAGLQAAHEQGLVHRDIKPENILLGEGVERVTITDFGLARAVDDNTVTRQGAIAGTPQYMSPEQARGEYVDQQSDLFSLGSVLYALCTGRAPFHDDTSYGVMRQIIDDSPTPICEINPKIPEWLTLVINRLMSKSKSDRFQSADEVHSVLEACLSHLQQPSANPLPPSLVNASSTPIKRKTVMKALIGSVALIFLFFASFSAQGLFQSRQQAGANASMPLLAMDGYIRTMMNPDSVKNPDSIFLNIGGIGEHDNGVSLKPVNSGVELTYNVFDSFPRGPRQGQFVEKLKRTAEKLSLSLDEDSRMDENGTIEGIVMKFNISGEPDDVCKKAIRLMTDTFGVDSTELCDFAFQNMPGTSIKTNVPGPRQVSPKKLVSLFESGKYQYAGEVANTIFIGLKESVALEYVPWDDTICWTEVDQLSQDDLKRIRLNK